MEPCKPKDPALRSSIHNFDPLAREDPKVTENDPCATCIPRDCEMYQGRSYEKPCPHYTGLPPRRRRGPSTALLAIILIVAIGIFLGIVAFMLRPPGPSPQEREQIINTATQQVMDIIDNAAARKCPCPCPEEQEPDAS